jgi:hypothetical protein
VSVITAGDAVGDGYQIDLDAVRDAGKKVYAGSDAIGDAAALFGLAGVGADAFGQLPEAGEFAGALGSFVDRHGTDLRHGSVWVNATGDAVMTSVTEYERLDQDAATGLDRAAGGQ